MASRPPDQQFDTTRQSDEARGRWLVLSVMRLTGALLVIIGMLLTQNAIDIAADLNMPIGYFFIVMGLIDMFVAPRLLARRWRTPKQ